MEPAVSVVVLLAVARAAVVTAAGVMAVERVVVARAAAEQLR